MAVKETKEEFIQKSLKVHGTKYDYSLVSMKGNNVKVDIICPIHGLFHQTPGHHKSGKGCKKCATAKNADNCRELYSDFIEEVLIIHNEKFEYKTLPAGSFRPLRIDLKCPYHGWFEMSAYDHKAGKGCKKCATENLIKSRINTTEQFIEKAELVHGDRYDYSLVEVVNDSTLVTIICKDHGNFNVTPASHKTGRNCPDCANIMKSVNQLDSLEDFIIKSVKVHGNKYDYSLANKTSSDIHNVEIICPVHGVFEQTAGNHKSGKGCPSCAVSGYDTKKSGTFYILICDELTKVGITNKKPSFRIQSINRTSGLSFKLHSSIFSEDGKFIDNLENKVLKWLRSKYTNPSQKFDGYTECFLSVNIEELLNFISDKED